jgi:hypothetical protein
MAAPRECGHFLGGLPVIMAKIEQGTAQDDQAGKAAKLIASIIIVGIVAMFAYGFFH